MHLYEHSIGSSTEAWIHFGFDDNNPLIKIERLNNKIDWLQWVNQSDIRYQLVLKMTDHSIRSLTTHSILTMHYESFSSHGMSNNTHKCAHGSREWQIVANLQGWNWTTWISKHQWIQVFKAIGTSNLGDMKCFLNQIFMSIMKRLPITIFWLVSFSTGQDKGVSISHLDYTVEMFRNKLVNLS